MLATGFIPIKKMAAEGTIKYAPFSHRIGGN